MKQHLVELYQPNWSFNEANNVAREIAKELNTTVTIGYDENVAGEDILRIALKLDLHLVRVDVTHVQYHKTNGEASYGKSSVFTIEEAEEMKRQTDPNPDRDTRIHPIFKYPSLERWNLLIHESARNIPF